MRIAIIHYHLRPGGVTRVIQHAESALSEVNQHISSPKAIQTLVLTGESPTASMPISSDYAIVEALKYNTSSNSSVQQICDQVEAVVTEKLGGPPDVWHFHNHSLGKNLIVPEIVHHLAQKGHRLLLQIHDLAEDGRPGNYELLRSHFSDALTLGSHVYPQAPHIHYAFINTKDLRCFQASQVADAQLHYLPDPVELDASQYTEPPKHYNERLFLYPSRTIRRKNLGEFLLWSALPEKGDRFAVTRAPKNPQHLPIYNDWVTFARAVKLPVDFEVGEQWQGDFSSLLQSASFLVSTSVAEGFGLAFLEPWLAERPLVGRKLPEITNQFEHDGINLSGLYEKLLVPIVWIGRERFEQEVQRALIRAYKAYGRTAQPDDIERAVEAAITDDYVDFGRLNEPLQQAVIEQIVREPSLKQEVLPSILEGSGDHTSVISQNKQIVEDGYNIRQYGKRLLHIYQAVAASPVGPVSGIDADRLLDQYLAPERFWLLSS
jgi:glycosyltransferase involved in cell wall biosynthesis